MGQKNFPRVFMTLMRHEVARSGFRWYFVDVIERDSEIKLLNQAASIDFETEPAWWWSFLTRTLRVPPASYPIVRDVLAKGRWRDSPKPIGYIKTAVKRIARRGVWLQDATDDPPPPTDGVRAWNFISRADIEMATEDIRGAGALSLAHDLALERLAYEAEQQEARAGSISDILRYGSIDWPALLGEIKDEEMRRYVESRLRGQSTAGYSEATRKRFQRSLIGLRKLISKHLYWGEPPSEDFAEAA